MFESTFAYHPPSTQSEIQMSRRINPVVDLGLSDTKPPSKNDGETSRKPPSPPGTIKKYYNDSTDEELEEDSLESSEFSQDIDDNQNDPLNVVSNDEIIEDEEENE